MTPVALEGVGLFGVLVARARAEGTTEENRMPDSENFPAWGLRLT